MLTQTEIFKTLAYFSSRKHTASNYYQTASLFIPEGHFKRKKTMIFGQLASEAMQFSKFQAGTRKPLTDFWSPLLEQPVKFVLISARQLCTAEIMTQAIFTKSHFHPYMGFKVHTE